MGAANVIVFVATYFVVLNFLPRFLLILLLISEGVVFAKFKASSSFDGTGFFFSSSKLLLPAGIIPKFLNQILFLGYRRNKTFLSLKSMQLEQLYFELFF